MKLPGNKAGNLVQSRGGSALRYARQNRLGLPLIVVLRVVTSIFVRIGIIEIDQPASCHMWQYRFDTFPTPASVYNGKITDRIVDPREIIIIRSRPAGNFRVTEAQGLQPGTGLAKPAFVVLYRMHACCAARQPGGRGARAEFYDPAFSAPHVSADLPDRGNRPPWLARSRADQLPEKPLTASHRQVAQFRKGNKLIFFGVQPRLSAWSASDYLLNERHNPPI